MKRITFAISFLLIQLSSYGQGVEFAPISFDQAIEKAKEEDKYVFIDFYTNWCAPCKLMDRDVFPLKVVGDYFNPRFISIKINGELGEGPDLVKKFKINPYPTFVILDKNGDLVHMFAGGILDGQKFVDKVGVSFNPEEAFGSLQDRYNAGERSNKFMSAYLQALINTHTVKPDPLVDDFYNSLSKKDRISQEVLFVYEMFAPLNSERLKFLETNREEFRDIVGVEKTDTILKSKYESFYAKILQGYSRDITIEEIKEIRAHIESMGITDFKTFPVYEKGALLLLTNEGKEDFLLMLDNTIPRLSNNEKDLMLFFIIPGLKKILNESEKEKLISMVSHDDTKGYITRSSK